MSKYNFEDLSPIDFEELSRDLLQKHLGVFLESFKEGKDQGIDLRYSKTNRNDIIVQCKRYSNFSDLKWNLRSENKKVKKLNPRRYVISTSLNLNPNQKNEIKNIFKGIKLFSKDILGRSEINNLLGKFPDIEKNHYKLWLNSAVILEKILHSGIYNRSTFDKEEIKRDLRIYVSNDSNKEATDIINKNNYVVISGIPGIGKTTLAKMLIYNFIKEDWELISISSDILEAEEMFKESKKQIFYYDDFLGTNFLAQFIKKNEDKRIIQFINKVKKSNDKLLILTTREYILNQAKQNFELLQDGSLEIVKCTIDLKKYNKLIKGRILYNHLFYSKLHYLYINEILKDHRYLNIINHPNYNPRLIQYLTDEKFIGNISSDNYYDFIIDNLANPKQIWYFAFVSHISPLSRYLLTIFLSLGEPVFKEHLYMAVNSFFEMNAKYYGITVNYFEFDKSLKECERTFININKNDIDDAIYITFQNPSIKDFILNYLNDNPELVKHLLNASIFFNQFIGIYSTTKENETVYINEMMQRLIFSKIKNVFYTIEVSSLSREFDYKKFHFYWKVKNFSSIERLEKLSRFLNSTSHTSFIDYLFNEFNKINLDENIFGEDELSSYLSLVENLNYHRRIDGKNIINKFIDKDRIKNFEELEVVRSLHIIFRDEYNDYEANNRDKIHEVVSAVIDNEYSDLELNTSKDAIDLFLENITLVESHYHFFFTDLRNNALELLSSLEENETEEKKEIKSLSSPIFNSANDDEILTNIFNSLKQ